MAAADQNRHDSAVRPRSYQDESYQHGFLGAVSDLQKAGVLQDVVLEVEGRRFPCHRLVLSAASPYFRAMFTSGMAESRQKTVVLQDLDADMFCEILSYIYSGTLHVSLDKVQPLYQAADLLQLDYVRDTCSSYMAMNVERSTCVDLYKFADVFSIDSVRNQCLQCICRHFSKIVSSEEFCSLSVNQLTEIISHDELDVKEETAVWEAVVRWVQHCKKDRLRHLPSILPHIRFNLLTPYNMVAILDHPLVKKNPGRSAIRNVVKETSNLKKRVGMDTLEMAVLFNETGIYSKEILFTNPREGKYISCSYTQDFRLLPWTVTVTSDNSIYILGYISELKSLDHQLFVLEYSHTGNVWERASIPPVQWPDDRVGYLVEVDRILYCLLVERSGSNYTPTSVEMSSCSLHTKQWQECSPLHVQADQEVNVVFRPLVVPCGSHLYFLRNAELHRYDPIQDRWHKLTPLRLKLDRELEVCSAISMGTEIFCTDTEFTKTMVYDTESDCWQVLPGWPNSEDLAPNNEPKLFVLDNQLHVWVEPYRISTDDAEGKLIFVYDRSAGAWKDLEVTVPLHVYAACQTMCPVARMYLPCLNAHGISEDM
ncbi:kelch repeat and BTB domain-containing protein 12-like [Branchiostoma lanceolatum]|uniref:kelch repeat and BTB domain-containing protein 12-like n=1 Tax=Branchiostoma lanceolatum TaxID=7740 RepID=UPI003456E715